MTTSKKVACVVLNGPQGSGKDTAVRGIQESHAFRTNYHTIYERVSKPLKAAVHAMFGFTVDYYGIGLLERTKDRPMYDGRAGSYSYRDLQIELYKRFATLLGEDWLAKLLLRRIENYIKSFGPRHDLLVMVDGGMENEVRLLADRYPTLIINIEREGYEFKDYRQHVTIEGIPSITIQNVTGTPSKFKEKVADEVLKWLEGLKWPNS